MKITVRYSGQARQAAGAAEESVEMAPRSSLNDLIKKLSGIHADGLNKLLLSASGEPNTSVLIFVDDEQVFPSEPNELSEGEIVEILSPISGG
jgi:molybdopterin converting factor small subunit